MPPWSHPATEELLGMAVDALAAGDRRGLTLLSEVLTRECGAQFAATVTGALTAGAPLGAFDFLPVPRIGTPAAPPADPNEPAPTNTRPSAPQGAGDPTPDSATTTAPPRAPAADETAPTDPGAPVARRVAPHHRTLAPGTPPPLPPSGYVTAIEVAEHFGVSVKAVYRWMATGRIRAERRPGGSYRIPAEQFTE